VTSNDQEQVAEVMRNPAGEAGSVRHISRNPKNRRPRTPGMTL
jgi:hypothetical protein